MEPQSGIRSGAQVCEPCHDALTAPYRGLGTSVEVGAALTEIREQRLYRLRDGFTTFEAYCKERWGFTRDKADRLIGAAAVAEVLTPVGVKKPGHILRSVQPASFALDHTSAPVTVSVERLAWNAQSASKSALSRRFST